MDYFDILLAKKLSGGGGGEITVEGLSVEENGTYTAPSGKAYSPVVVNLPLGEKAITANGEYNASADDLKGYSKVTVNVEGYKVKSMPAGAVSSFADGTDNPLRDLKVSIVPVQSGSGDPSPSNPRPISGWTGANVHVADGENPHVIDNVVNVSWQTEAGTVYGGELDVTSGVLTVNFVGVVLRETTQFSFPSAGAVWYSPNDVIVPSTSELDYVKSSHYKTVLQGSTDDNSIAKTFGNKIIRIIDSVNATSLQDYKDYLEAQYANGTPVQVMYQLAEPLIYQLSPTQVSSILGTNNIGADTGDILEGEYFVAL